MFWRVWLINTASVVLMLLLAIASGMGTPSQMHRLGYNRGVPALCHGAWWADLLILGFTQATIITVYSNQWSTKAIIGLLIVSAVVTVLANNSYLEMSRDVPNYTQVGGHYTPAGMLHLPYAIVVFALGLLYYFGTHHSVNKTYVCWIVAGSAVHTVAAFVQPALYAGDSLRTPGLLKPLVVITLLHLIGFVRLYWMIPS